MNTFAPAEQSKRVQSLDILRGVAVLGILLINIVGMALPDPAYFDPSSTGGDTGWNLRVFIINSILFEGAMRGLFSLLFGAGIVLFISNKEKEGNGFEILEVWQIRLIWLILFGLQLYGFFSWWQVPCG